MITNTHRFGLAGSITVGIVYTVMSALIKFFPSQSIDFFASIHMAMIDTNTVMKYINITMASFIIGLVGHLIIAYLLFSLFAIVYNKL